MAHMLGIHASVIRGSIGGNTFLANQFHPIIVRARVAPVDPSTTAQAQIRAGMGTGSVVWDSLISTAQDAWDAWAESIVFTGPTGSYTVPGRQLFVAARAFQEYLEDLGQTITKVVTAPVVNSLVKLGNPKTAAPSVTGTGVNVQIKNNDSDKVTVMIQRSIPFTLSRKRFKGPFLSSSVEFLELNSGVTDDVDFLGLEAGKAYFFKVSAVTNDTAPRFSKKLYVRGVASVTV